MTYALITLADGHQLAPAPATAYARALAAGCPGGITSAYRDPAAQAVLRAEYLAAPTSHAYAAPVGQSEHVTGYAIDLPAAAAAWMHNQPGYGFAFTDPNEWWHVAYRVALDRHLTDTVTPPTPPTPVQEDDMSAAGEAAIQATLANIESILAVERNGGIRGDLLGMRGEVDKIRPDINTVASELRALRSVTDAIAARDAGAIAAAIPTDIAKQVADLLAARLAT